MFPTGRDSTTFRDKGTELPSLSWGKGTTSKFCQGTGRAGTACQNPGQDAGRDEILTAVPSRGTKWDRAEKDVLKQKKDVLKQKKDILKQENNVLKQKRMF